MIGVTKGARGDTASKSLLAKGNLANSASVKAMRLMGKWRRLKYRWYIWRNSGDQLNRRVSVENYLLNAAAGRKPLPDAEKCRELADKLGIPGEYR